MNADLLCPKCHEPALHQVRVTVGFRRAEDEKESLVTTIDKSGASMKLGPLPERRDWLEIEFACEHCHGFDPPYSKAPYLLRVFQSRGSTLMEWDGKDTKVTLSD